MLSINLADTSSKEKEIPNIEINFIRDLVSIICLWGFHS